MLTADERARIRNTPCPWGNCQSVVGEDCWFRGPKGERRMVTTAEGGFHDMRVQKALGRPNRVLARDPDTGSMRPVEPPPAVGERQPVLVGQAMPAGLSGPHSGSEDPDCPW